MNVEAIAIKLAAWWVIGQAIVWGILIITFVVAIILEIIKAIKGAKDEHRTEK